MSDGYSSSLDGALPLPTSAETQDSLTVPETLPVRTPIQEATSITNAWLAEETVKWGLKGNMTPESPAKDYFDSVLKLAQVDSGQKPVDAQSPILIKGGLRYTNDGNGIQFNQSGIEITHIVGVDPSGSYLCSTEFDIVTIPAPIFKNMLAQSEATALVAHASELGPVVQAALSGKPGASTIEAMATQARGAKLVPRDTLIASLKNVISPDKVALVEASLRGEYASPRMVAEALSASGFLRQPEQYFNGLIAQLQKNPGTNAQEVANNLAVIAQLELKRDAAVTQAEKLTASGANETDMISRAFDQMNTDQYEGFMKSLESGNAEAGIQALIDSLPKEQQSEWRGKFKGLAGAGGTALMIALYLMVVEAGKQQ